jgi:hypothetical protein
MGSHKPLPSFKSHILPCTRKRIFKPGIQCQFELLAVRQENGTIDVYAHSKHNHPIMPEGTSYSCQYFDILILKKL